MSGKTVEWLIVLLFFACFFVFTVCEILWLRRRESVELGRAFAFSFGSNMLCVTVGFFISMVIVGVILAMAWDGSLQNVPGGDPAIWATLSVALIVPFALLVFAKRLMLTLLGIKIARPLRYASAASCLFFVAVMVIPAIFVYFLIR